MAKKKAKRIRPKSFNLSTSNHSLLRRRWLKWLPALMNDLIDMLDKQEIFWELQEVVRENPSIGSPGYFLSWMSRNYVVAISVGIRSFTDQSNDVQSLWRMLFEILENPKVINRSAHIELYGTDSIRLGDITFNNVVGRDKQHLSQTAVRSDLRRLENTSERIRKFVNKRVAHRTAPGKMRRLPKYHQIDDALETLDKILCKYALLLTAYGLDTLKPSHSGVWKEVLHQPWIPKKVHR